MAEPAGPFYALRLGDHQYLCYCAAQESSGFNIYVTNASEVWSTDFTPEKLEGHKAQSGICPSEDYSTKFREAFEHRAAALTVHDSKATLQLKEGTWSLTFDLFKLPCSEARNQLQALMFGLVGCVSSLEKRLEAAEDAAASCSPEKNLLQSQRLLIPDLSPRKNRGGGSAMTAKRRVPGESLINPGFKSGARCPSDVLTGRPESGYHGGAGGAGSSTCTSSFSAVATSFLPASRAGRQTAGCSSRPSPRAEGAQLVEEEVRRHRPGWILKTP
ncbi:unnamed protein product, partial [Eretmochelys imbricata]